MTYDGHLDAMAAALTDEHCGHPNHGSSDHDCAPFTSTRPHVTFRRYPWQRFLRCTTPGCGFIARDKNAHIAHANGIRKPHEEDMP